MRTTLEMVHEFHVAFQLLDQLVDRPGIPDAKVRLLRVQCLTEEISEFAHAIGKEDRVEVLDALTDIQYFLDGAYLIFGLQDEKIDGQPHVHYTLPSPPRAYYALPSANDTLFNMQYLLGDTLRLSRVNNVLDARITLNTFQAHLNLVYKDCGMYGVKQAAFEEVHRSNMTKLGPGGYPVRDASGRVVKPEGWVGPQLAQFV